MRICRFEARGLHEYLQFDFSFHQQLTFLTGINGSGKTSALNAMIALISADLSMLSGMSYAYISVTIENDRKQQTIWALSDKTSVSLGISGVDTPLSFERYTIESDAPSYRQVDARKEYYKEIAQAKSTHPVLRALSVIPNPMFLGIDRRSTLGLGRTTVGMTRQPRFGRNIFSKSLSGSVALAVDLAERRYRDALIQSARLTNRLQREMLLRLLGSGADDIAAQLTLKLPTPDDVRELKRVRRDTHSIAHVMNLPIDEVEKRLLPLLDELQSLADEIGHFENIQQAVSENHKIVEPIARWSANQSHLVRIRFISQKIADYNELRKQNLAPTDNYRDLVNGFLRDSGKSIVFNDDGYIGVDIEGVSGVRQISSLSSGEAQIFVILTHLAFNPSAQTDNVFIIDEPELSLHIQWQELFVESILSANPNIQYILATHSPSIILDRLENCIDISCKKMALPLRDRAKSDRL